MKTVILRFLGAFGKARTLKDALAFEFARTDEVCATSGAEIEHVGVALWMRRCAIIRKNRGDVWSVSENGRLKATRKAVKTHAEFWVRGGRDNIKGVVVTRPISAQAFAEIRHFCAANATPMFVAGKNGNLKPVVVY